MTKQEFYEDDKRAEDVFAAFEAGEKLRTQPATRGQTSASILRAPGQGKP